MGRLGKVIVGMLLSFAIVGCGEEELDSGGMPFKNTDTSQFESLNDQMKASLKKRDYVARPKPAKAKKEAEPKAPPKTEEKTE
jgi:hypothetical protein